MLPKVALLGICAQGQMSQGNGVGLWKTLDPPIPPSSELGPGPRLEVSLVLTRKVLGCLAYFAITEVKLFPKRSSAAFSAQFSSERSSCRG